MPPVPVPSLPLPTCCSCLEELTSLVGTISCSKKHITCNDCINGNAKNDLGEEGVRKHGGKVRCPWRGAIGAGKAEVCSSQPWDRSALKDLLTAETMFELLESAHVVVKQATENELVLAKKVTDAENAGGALAARTLAATEAAAGQQRADRIRTHRLAIVESVLTLHCPRCSSAFLDYAGCDAVICSKPGCGCSFCALCLADCGVDAHPHCLAAKHIPGRAPTYHSTQVQFNAFHAARMRKGVDEAVARIAEDASFKKELLELLNKDLREAGTVVAQQQPPPPPAPVFARIPGRKARRRAGARPQAQPQPQPMQPLQLDPRQLQPGFGLGRDYVPGAAAPGAGGAAGQMGIALQAMIMQARQMLQPPPPVFRPAPRPAVPFNVAVANLDDLEERLGGKPGKTLKERQNEELENTRRAIRASIAIDVERQKAIQASLRKNVGGDDLIDLSGGGSGSGGGSSEASKQKSFLSGEVVDLTSSEFDDSTRKRSVVGVVDLSMAPTSSSSSSSSSSTRQGSRKLKEQSSNIGGSLEDEPIFIDLSIENAKGIDSPILITELSQSQEEVVSVQPSRKRTREVAK